MPTPELAYLKRLGLTHETIARLLGTDRHVVSNWLHDHREMSEPYRRDLIALRDRVHEGMAQGKTVHEAIEGFYPTSFDNSGGVTESPNIGVPILDVEANRPALPPEAPWQERWEEQMTCDLRSMLHYLASLKDEDLTSALVVDRFRRLGMALALQAHHVQQARVDMFIDD